jgi:nitrite reductase/ring-hydroxylating ferredoxin subunit
VIGQKYNWEKFSMDDVNLPVGSEMHGVDLSERRAWRNEPPSPTVKDILEADRIPAPATLLARSDYVPPNEPIPVSRYIDTGFHELEIEKVWNRTWQMVCWSHDIPNAGDVSVYRSVGKSVLIVRQRDGSLKAFVNSCLHRGMEICSEQSTRSQLRCPYHAFTWQLDGALEWVPSKWDFPQVKRENFRLPEVRLEEWNGFAFVNFDAGAPPLAEYLGAMTDHWSEWDWSNRYRVVTVEKHINCNWKACLDAFIETLHVYSSHPQAAALIADTATQYDVYPDQPHFSRFHTLTGLPSENLVPQPSPQDVLDSYTGTYLAEIFGTPAGDIAEGETIRDALTRLSVDIYKERLGLDVSNMPQSELLDGTQYFVFPNFLIWPSLANPLVYRFRPDGGPDKAIWETMIFLPFSGERKPSGPTIVLGPEDNIADVAELGLFAPILQQDSENLDRLQAGLHANPDGVLQLASYQEARIRHYHQTLGKYINEELGVPGCTAG